MQARPLIIDCIARAAASAGRAIDLREPAMPEYKAAPRNPALRRIALAALLSLPAGWTAAAEEKAADAAKPPKLFSSQDTLELTMEAPWRDVERKKSYQGTYPAKLRFQGADGLPVTIDMTVARRGIKRQEACSFPPIRLRFEKEAVKGTVFRGQKSLKMVTHCKDSTRFDQYYILEMLAYRMYNLLTDVSFRVRPLQVTYVDSQAGRSEGPRFAFLIEDDSDVAKRNDLKKLDLPRISPDRLDTETSSLMSLFQFMIGNTDWAALAGPDPSECCHNVKLVGPEPLGPQDFAFPLPYDFDSSGLVDARYAAPHEDLPIRSVTTRLFRGYCEHNATLESARQAILGEEAAIRALVADEPRLTSGSKKKAGRFLDDFFEIAEDSGKFEKNVTGRCRK
jgi:hypothetical protein